MPTHRDGVLTAFVAIEGRLISKTGFVRFGGKIEVDETGIFTFEPGREEELPLESLVRIYQRRSVPVRKGRHAKEGEQLVLTLET